jgi:putative aminopeptidase FrvX
MNEQELLKLAARVLRHPTAPYFEHAVRAEVESVCREYGLRHRRDDFGNVIVELKTAVAGRPVVLAAHMDHPGFEIVKPLGQQRWLARFRGGVPDQYFRRGLRVRLMPGNITARLTSRVNHHERWFALRAARPATTRPEFATWDLKDFQVRNRRLYSRACDDLIGVVTVLATLVDLKASRARVNVIGLLSRAEEVGFHGALAAASESGRRACLPKNALVISLETSRELPGVEIGQGVILRVGDRASVFDAQAMRFLSEVSGELKRRRQEFRFQRGLMSGGTCEATAFQELGFQTAAVCVGLGNYHNCGERNRIRAEYVDIGDVGTMVNLLAEAARRMADFRELVGRLPQRLRRLLREARPRLRSTA